MYNNSVNEGKTAAIISYLWWIGLIISFIMNHNKRNYFTSFHIRQSIGLSVLLFLISILTKFAFPIVGSALFLGWFVLWIIGLLAAIKGEEKEVPFLGEKFQEWFRNI